MKMTLTKVAYLLSILCAFSINLAYAQDDTEGVKATSKAFYTALSELDTAAMEKVWAHTPDVVFVSPRSKDITIGWDAVRQLMENNTNAFTLRNVSLSKSHIRVNGNLAWEVGIETGKTQLKTEDAPRDFEAFVTNVYEKSDGQWRMVSHVVHPKAQ